MDNTPSLLDYRPWEDETASPEDNLEAYRAFQALLTLNLGSPSELADTNSTFVRRVTEVAEEVFDHQYQSPQLSALVGGFYDAALLYAAGDIYVCLVFMTVFQASISQ